jgi:MarR family transcriptional repressor of emrRAB
MHNCRATVALASDRLANVLGASVVALHDRLVNDGLAALPPPANQPSAAATLALLKWVPRIPQGRLAYCLGLSQPATVRLVDRLQAAGLVRRNRVRQRRQVWVESTWLGRKLASRLGIRRRTAMNAVLVNLSATERALLAGLLQRLAAQLLESKEHVMRICRLCDARACGTDDDCPMWRAARVLD